MYFARRRSYGLGVQETLCRPWGKLRQEILENLIALFESKWDEDKMKISKEGKFRSITVMKKELFTDISAMPGLLSKQVAFLKTQKVRKHIQPLLST